MKSKRFDTDTNALNKRLDAHKKYGSNEINDWIFKHLNLKKGLNVLELGCGTGKQLIPAAKQVYPSFVLGIDISKDVIKEKIFNIEYLLSDFDNLDSKIKSNYYDVVYSCFSIYYTKDIDKLLNNIYNWLKDKGMFFICMPNENNNMELKRFHYGLTNESVPNESRCSDTYKKICENKSFRKIDKDVFENILRFPSAKSLYEYWKHYNLYDKKIELIFKKKIYEYFESHYYFVTVKKVDGIILWK